jgi:hypothetical protein
VMPPPSFRPPVDPLPPRGVAIVTWLPA